MKRRIVVLAAVAFLLSGVAVAGDVSFTTSGTFSNPNLFPLTFRGVDDTNVKANGPLGIDLSLGTFTLRGCVGPKQCTGSETFTLVIDQISPDRGKEPLIGKLVGTVKKIDGQVTITFTSATITEGNVTYTLPLFESLSLGNEHSMCLSLTMLRGNVLYSSVPEPSSRLLLVMAAFGLIALTIASRRFVRA